METDRNEEKPLPMTQQSPPRDSSGFSPEQRDVLSGRRLICDDEEEEDSDVSLTYDAAEGTARM